jgi:pimeloyl-ACP methyl ester carboxylesterase
MPLFVRVAAALILALVLAGCASTANELGRPGGPPFAVVDGVRVPYVQAGSGSEAIVFVHGWACDRTFWDAQLADPVLGRGRRLIALDLPGHGQSDKPKTPYTMDLFVRSISAVMDHAGVERAVLVGHSNGTPMIRQFYRQHPERTAGLVVVDGALRSFFTSSTQWNEFIDPLRGKEYQRNAQQMIDGMVKPIGDEALRNRISVSMLATPQWVMVGAMEAVSAPSVWAEDMIKVPTLVVLAKSPFWTDGYEQWVKRLAPRSEYHIMDGVSHFLMMERPREFNGTMELWLSANGF